MSDNRAPAEPPVDIKAESVYGFFHHIKDLPLIKKWGAICCVAKKTKEVGVLVSALYTVQCVISSSSRDNGFVFHNEELLNMENRCLYHVEIPCFGEKIHNALLKLANDMCALFGDKLKSLPSSFDFPTKHGDNTSKCFGDLLNLIFALTNTTLMDENEIAAFVDEFGELLKKGQVKTKYTFQVLIMNAQLSNWLAWILLTLLGHNFKTFIMIPETDAPVLPDTLIVLKRYGTVIIGGNVVL